MPMSSSKPYLIRAINEWIVDNGLTTHLLVKASFPGTLVPEQFVKDDRIVLNISVSAAHNLELGNQLITFRSRFSGKPFDIRLPVDAIMAVYARENGKGMVFQDEPGSAPAQPDLTEAASKKPVLTVVK